MNNLEQILIRWAHANPNFIHFLQSIPEYKRSFFVVSLLCLAVLLSIWVVWQIYRKKIFSLEYKVVQARVSAQKTKFIKQKTKILKLPEDNHSGPYGDIDISKKRFSDLKKINLAYWLTGVLSCRSIPVYMKNTGITGPIERSKAEIIASKFYLEEGALVCDLLTCDEFIGSKGTAVDANIKAGHLDLSCGNMDFLEEGDKGRTIECDTISTGGNLQFECRVVVDGKIWHESKKLKEVEDQNKPRLKNIRTTDQQKKTSTEVIDMRPIQSDRLLQVTPIMPSRRLNFFLWFTFRRARNFVLGLLLASLCSYVILQEIERTTWYKKTMNDLVGQQLKNQTEQTNNSRSISNRQNNTITPKLDLPEPKTQTTPNNTSYTKTPKQETTNIIKAEPIPDSRVETKKQDSTAVIKPMISTENQKTYHEQPDTPADSARKVNLARIVYERIVNEIQDKNSLRNTPTKNRDAIIIEQENNLCHAILSYSMALSHHLTTLNDAVFGLDARLQEIMTSIALTDSEKKESKKKIEQQRIALNRSRVITDQELDKIEHSPIDYKNCSN